ncbi:hypothetical protein AURDEDRAFT_182601 [Auricularia subglabra TFB-10046 SS5]|nr:hypothetical protein AURDEDRAFT_182601 [Auricularia subglabra TFB-10046 SS5]
MSAESANVRLARQFLLAISTKDFAGLAAILSDDFAVQVLPESLGMGETSKEKFLGNLAGLENLTNTGTMNLKPLEIIDAPATNQVVAHAKIVDTFSKDGKTPFTNEYIFIFNFADGKITGGKEFVDSKTLSEFFATHARK